MIASHTASGFLLRILFLIPLAQGMTDYASHTRLRRQRSLRRTSEPGGFNFLGGKSIELLYSPPFDPSKICPVEPQMYGENYLPGPGPAADHLLIGVGDWHGDLGAAIETLVVKTAVTRTGIPLCHAETIHSLKLLKPTLRQCFRILMYTAGRRYLTLKNLLPVQAVAVGSQKTQL